jgi:hypothetical protein
MAIPDLPILSMLRTRMQWHQQRQRVLAENIAHADTPRYHARDLAPPNFASALQRASVTMARTHPGHIEAAGGSVQFDDDRNATDMHHLVIAALNDSYTLFQPGDLPTSGDAAALITKTVAGAFRIGIQLSAPFIVFGLLFNIGLGILARLMPQMQVFFVGLPLSILVGLLFLLLLLGAMMSFFLDYAGSVLHALTPHG